MTKSRHILPARHVWTWAELELLTRNYADSRTDDIATALGMRLDRVFAKANRLGLKKSAAYLSSEAAGRLQHRLDAGKMHRFPKGNVPANKGVKRPPGWSTENMQSTQFKPGNAPHTTLPLGSHRVNGDGYLEVKFSEEPGPYTMRWVPVHRDIWVRVNGPVPKGCVLAFKPGRRTTELAAITLDAIELLTFAQNLARNSIHNLPPALVKVTQLRGVLNRQINKLRKAK